MKICSLGGRSMKPFSTHWPISSDPYLSDSFILSPYSYH